MGSHLLRARALSAVAVFWAPAGFCEGGGAGGDAGLAPVLLCWGGGSRVRELSLVGVHMVCWCI